MMINTNNYAEIIAQARAIGASVVNFDQKTQAVQPIAGQKDTVTLSDQALAKLNGQALAQQAPTYIKPETARSLLAQARSAEPTENDKVVTDDRFGEMMQNILDKHLGVDREKLAEIDAMMEEIAKNENMSPKEKAKALEELAKMREEIIEQSMKLKDTAEKTFSNNQDE